MTNIEPTSEGGKPTGDPADETRSSRQKENFHADLDFGVLDYLALPSFGDGYFSLADAAMLAALDDWWWNFGEGGDPDFSDLIADQKARAVAQPMQQLVVKALVRSIALKELDAHVLARDLATSEAVPERTYAHILDIVDCLEKYGIGEGHLMQTAKSLDDEDFYEVATAVSRRRAAIRMGISSDPEEIPNENPFAVIEVLRKELRAKKLQIAHLEQQGSTRIGDARPLGARQRNNLHRAIGALLALLLPHYNDKQDALIAEIESRFSGNEGLSKRTLESIFPLAKKALSAEH
ncbi:hypothetical protein M0765_026645 [Variovorax sp. S2]|uniref:hypothetical protein n=1 Tax=Variovorax sp. S12S4 TaxID=3029170 RepID=UPI00215BF4B4|nr:hypothetical protein [Variovorax sp. S12S4]MCR8961178.1 hypothetical protein [Variovorax sp. S12S4]